jgi:hypothetical protein
MEHLIAIPIALAATYGLASLASWLLTERGPNTGHAAACQCGRCLPYGQRGE